MIEQEQFIDVLTKVMKDAAQKMSKSEVRLLVDGYYQIQEYRKATGNQITQLIKQQVGDEKLKTWIDNDLKKIMAEIGSMGYATFDLILYIYENTERLEKNIRAILDKYSNASHIGQWCREITGIGPVIAAGLLAHIEIEKAPTAGHIWSFAGLDPDRKWEKGKKRPWNASLKTLCWKIGESFVKVSNNPKDVYGKLYQQRKALEDQRNDRLEFRSQAENKIEEIQRNKISWNSFQQTVSYTDYYSQGKLPPAHIHARAKRYAVKIFLSHLHGEMYRDHYHCEPPVPFAVAILGHAHVI